VTDEEHTPARNSFRICQGCDRPWPCPAALSASKKNEKRGWTVWGQKRK
jgi:hypothetical protein